MRNMIKQSIYLTALLLAVQSWAGEVQMRITPEVIDLLDRAVLEIDFINTEPESVSLPKIEGLKFEHLGPSRQTVIINGQVTKSVSHSYVVTPSKVGTFVIAPVTVKYDGTETKLSTQLQVIKKSQDTETEKLSDRMFARISLVEAEPYVYEPFTLKYTIYVKDGTQVAWEDAFGRTLFSVQGGMPEKGLDGEADWKFNRRGREVIDGNIYETFTFHVDVRTLASGPLTFQPNVQIHWIVPAQERRTYGMIDPFRGDLFGRPEARPYTLECNALDVLVHPIPSAGRPASFSGGVGVFDFEVEVGPDEVEALDPVTIKMRISGAGNLEMLTPPALADNPSIKTYESKSVPTQAPNEIRFEQIVTPESEDAREIPAISFSYFNTKTEDFRTITRGPFPIRVTPAQKQTTPLVSTVSVAQPQATEIIAQDIAYLKPAPNEWISVSARTSQRTALLAWLLALPALLVAITGTAVARRNRIAANVALSRRQQAPRAARKQIRRADRACQDNDEAAFYEAAWDVLSTYFGHRLNLAPGQITLHAVLEEVPDESGDITWLFETVEQRRYGIRGDDDDPQQEMRLLLRRLQGTLRTCERIKR